ncbi:MAG: hypothetical protein OXU45_02520 [Candidatus Melainabacteria bacterium]|nr:hypothetical protein [Candidatus Melainabacteria bacterium]
MTTLVLNPMQRDLELFEEFDLSQKTEPIFFFYTWDRPAVTVGKAQRGREQIMAEATELGIDCFTRPTGGKAVLHGGDICYSFIGTQADPIYGGKLRDSFKAVNQMVIKMVNEVLGLSLSGANKAIGQLGLSPNCFANAVCNEGIYADHKIVGAAQAMGKRAFIQQGSIQLNRIKYRLESLAKNLTLSDLSHEQYDLIQLAMELSSKR